MRSKVRLWLSCALVAWGLFGCATHQVRQAALVSPPLLPPLPRAESALLDLYVEDATVTFLSLPEREPNSDSALYIARTNLQGAVSLRLSEHFDLRITGMGAPSAGAISTGGTALAAPSLAIGGGGLGLTTRFTLQDIGHRIQFTLDLQLMGFSSRFEKTCIDNCGMRTGEVQRGQTRHIEGDFAFGVDYLIPMGEALTWALRAGLRPQRYNRAVVLGDDTTDATLDGARTYVILGGALMIRLLPYLQLTPGLQWPVTPGPIRYGPIVSVGLRGVVPD